MYGNGSLEREISTVLSGVSSLTTETVHADNRAETWLKSHTCTAHAVYMYSTVLTILKCLFPLASSRQSNSSCLSLASATTYWIWTNWPGKDSIKWVGREQSDSSGKEHLRPIWCRQAFRITSWHVPSWNSSRGQQAIGHDPAIKGSNLVKW